MDFLFNNLNDFAATLNNENKEKLKLLYDLYMPASKYEAEDLIFHFKRIQELPIEVLEKTLKTAIKSILNSVPVDKTIYPSQKVKILYKQIEFIQHAKARFNLNREMST